MQDGKTRLFLVIAVSVQLTSRFKKLRDVHFMSFICTPTVSGHVKRHFPQKRDQLQGHFQPKYIHMYFFFLLFSNSGIFKNPNSYLLNLLETDVLK